MGQLALDDNFMLNQSASLFLNANFGPLGVLSANNLAPQYPLGALGIWLGWDISSTNSVQIGIYDGNAGSDQSNQDGVDFHLSRSEGATIFLESNFSYEDFKFQFGSFIDTGKVFNYSNNQKVRGNYGLYLGVDQSLSQSINLFFRMGYTPIEKRNVNDFYLDLGVVGDGFYKHDKWGLSYIYSSLSREFFEKSNYAQRKDESVFELTYKYFACNSFSLQPNLQYIMNPIEGAEDTLAVGLRVHFRL